MHGNIATIRCVLIYSGEGEIYKRVMYKVTEMYKRVIRGRRSSGDVSLPQGDRITGEANSEGT